MPFSEVEALLRQGASAQERGARLRRMILGGMAALALLVIVSLAGYQVAMEMTGHGGYSPYDRAASE
jgi:hypothetical protein